MMSKIYGVMALLGLVVLGIAISMNMNPTWYLVGFLISAAGGIAILSTKKEVVYIEDSSNDIRKKYEAKRESKNYDFSSPDPSDVLKELEHIRTKSARRKRDSNKGDES